jgi:predicted permease
MRNVLVFQQVAVSMVLLLLTGFIVVGWQRSASVDVGFDTRNLYTVNLDPVRNGYTPEQARDFFSKLPTRLQSISGVQSVSLAQTLPLAMSSGETMMNAKVEFAGGARSFGAMRADRVGEGFFSTIGAAQLRGREFTQRDERDGSRVVIVNDTMANRVWPNEQAVGQFLDLEGSKWEVVGVVGDVRSAFPLAPRMPGVYRPVTPEGFRAPWMHGVTVVVRVASGFDAPVRLRRAIELMDPNVTVFHVKPVSEEIEQMLYLAAFATYVYGGMGVFGLMLASIGLAGVTAYSVARRTHEIGIRMALGATRRNVLALVLREGSVIILAGTILGLAIALAATRALASFVDTLGRTTSTSIADPVLLVGGPTLLALIALAACYVPARRSTRIDPAMALRAD